MTSPWKFVPFRPGDRRMWLHPPLFKSNRKIAELEQEVSELRLRLAHIENWLVSRNETPQ
jgi:hypothetical protein